MSGDLVHGAFHLVSTCIPDHCMAGTQLGLRFASSLRQQLLQGARRIASCCVPHVSEATTALKTTAAARALSPLSSLISGQKWLVACMLAVCISLEWLFHISHRFR